MREPSPVPPREPGPVRVLIADENTVQRGFHRFMAERLGLSVTEAADGQKAVEMALASDPDLVLVDLSMPGLDGIEATRRIREAEQRAGHSRITAIVVTADSSECTNRMAIEAGATEVVGKPMSSVALKALLAKLIPDWKPPATAP